MGACGCGDFDPDLVIAGPKPGEVYAIEINWPCRYCDTPLGLIVSHMTAEQREEACIEPDEIREIPVVQALGNIRETYATLLAPEAVKAAMAPYVASEDESDDGSVVADEIWQGVLSRPDKVGFQWPER